MPSRRYVRGGVRVHVGTGESEVPFAPEKRPLTWRYEVVTVRGGSQDRYRDLKTGRFIRKP